MASPQPFRAKPRPPTFDYISTAAPRRHRASQEHPTDSMRNKPAVQTALLGRAILHVRSRRANSRTSLAKVMELSPSTIGLYVDQLLKDAWFVEAGLDQGAKGRPTRQLQVRPEAGWYAGIEFNAERLQAVAIDFAGNHRSSTVLPLPPQVSRKAVIAAIEHSLETLQPHGPGKLLAIGLGVPGVVDPDAGLALHYSFIPDWRKVPIVQEIQGRYAVPVKLENNLRSIALAERWFGGGRALENYAILGPRIGFGVAIVQGGRLVSGVNHAAGEIGRWDWPFDQPAGEMQKTLSAPSIWRALQGLPSHTPLPTDLFHAFASLRPEAARLPHWPKIVEHFARVIGLLQLLLDTQCYFLHGPLTGLGPEFCEAIRQQAMRLMPGLEGNPFQLIPSSMGDDAGCLGAASLAMESWEPNIDRP
jgi:predicted NBD/HSP70 family sugar kinase